MNPVEEICDPVGDVVADQPHPLDAVDAAFRGFVGVPVFELSSRNGVDVSLAPECHHDVDVTNELLVDECGRPSTDVDTNLGQGLRRQIVDKCD